MGTSTPTDTVLIVPPPSARPPSDPPKNGPAGSPLLIHVETIGVGLSIAASTVCSMLAGVALGFIFGMNVQGCPELYSRNVIADKCVCTAGRCGLFALIAQEDGTRFWADTRAVCKKEKE
jgi:hypothetical protein